MALVMEVKQWDGKSVESIKRVFARYGRDDRFASDLIGMLDSEELQPGATWLLKHLIENGEVIAPELVAKICRNLKKLVRWESSLHILQCMHSMDLPKRNRRQVEKFLRECLLADNKFVRAWAYSGFYQLAVQHPEYRVEARRLVDTAMENENAASVKARIRKLAGKEFE